MEPTPEVTPPLEPTPTSAPATEAEAFTLYENDIFGMSISYPSNWQAQEGTNPAIDPILIAEGEAGLPRLLLYLFYLAEPRTPEEYAPFYQEDRQLDLPNMEVVSEVNTLTADGTPAYDMVLDFTDLSGEVPRRARVTLVTRGTQVFEIFAFTLLIDFDRQAEVIDEILQSFSLREPTPFGIPREEALTLFDAGPSTLDPHKVATTTDSQYVLQIFSGLVTLDQELNVIPDLAESWDILDGGKTYVFHLRDDAQFHDGKPVTASEFKYSFERATDPALGSKTASIYLNDIIGFQEKIRGEAQEFVGVEAIDDLTLRIRIDASKPYFLSKLTYPTAFVVDQQNVEAGDSNWFLEPNGTGPFKLKGWKSDRVLALERNENFYRGQAQVPYIVFRLFGGVSVAMYETDEIDVAYVGLGDLDRALDPAESLNQELHISTELTLFYLGFNSTRPPFDDPKVRKAFALALDRDRLVQEILEGAVEKAKGFLPPGIPGYNPDLAGIPFDPEQARALLAETTYGSGDGLPPLEYTTFRSRFDAVLIAILEMWQENLGVEVIINPISQGYFDFIEEQRGNIFDYGWVADYADPQNFLDVLFHSESTNNVGGYSNAEVDALLEEARTEPDPVRRLELYQQAEELLVEDVAAIPLRHDKSYIVVKPYVKNWFVSAQGNPDFLTVRLER